MSLNNSRSKPKNDFKKGVGIINNLNNMKELNEKVMLDHISEIKSAPKSSMILKSNSHLQNLTSSIWPGGGNLTVRGLIWWKANCYLGLTDFSSGVKAVKFSAKGTGFMLGAIDSEVFGSFIVNPKHISGKCHFKIVSGAVEGGVCTLFLYSTSGTFYGNFTGPAEGLGAGTMSGTGKLKVISI